MQITLMGATGMLGRPVAWALQRAGHQLKALVREPEPAQPHLPTSVELRPGDLRHPADIAGALQGGDALYLNLSVHPSSREKDFQPEREGLSNLLVEAQRQGIGRIAYLSSLVPQYQTKDTMASIGGFFA